MCARVWISFGSSSIRFPHRMTDRGLLTGWNDSKRKLPRSRPISWRIGPGDPRPAARPASGSRSDQLLQPVRMFLNLPTRHRIDDPGGKSPHRPNDAVDLLHELSAMFVGGGSGDIEERSRDIQIDAEE